MPLSSYIYMLPGLLLLVCSHRLLARKAPQSSLASHFHWAFGIRMLAGLSVGLVYHYHYGYGDTLVYHQDGLKLYAYAQQSPLAYLRFLLGEQPQDLPMLQMAYDQRALLFSKWVSLPILLSGGNYWIASCLLSLLSFYGSWQMASALSRRFPSTRQAAALAFFYFPSFVFWSSGILKESLLVAALGTLVADFLAAAEGRRRIGRLLRIGCCLLVLLWLKYYFLAALSVASLMALGYYLLLQMHKKSWGLLLLPMLVLSSYMLMPAIHVNLHPERIMEMLVLNTQQMSRATADPSNLIVYSDLAPNALSLLSQLPKACLEGLYRPFLSEGGSIFKQLTALENSLLLLLSMLSPMLLLQQKKKTATPYLVWIAVYVGILLPLLAIAAPNLGTLARYKSGYNALLVYTLLIPVLSAWQQYQHRSPRKQQSVLQEF